MNKVQESKLETKPELGYMSVLPTETNIQQRKKEQRSSCRKSLWNMNILIINQNHCQTKQMWKTSLYPLQNNR